MKLGKNFFESGSLKRFNEIQRGAFEIYLLLCAYSRGHRRVVTMSIMEMVGLSGYSYDKIVRVLRALENNKVISREHTRVGTIMSYCILL